MDVSSWIYEWIDEGCFCCSWNHHSSVQVHPISLPLFFPLISLIWSGSSLISGFFSAPRHHLVLISLLAIGPDFSQISIVQNTCLFYLSIYIPAEYIMLIVHRNANESNLLSWTYRCSGVVVLLSVSSPNNSSTILLDTFHHHKQASKQLWALCIQTLEIAACDLLQ